VESQLMKVEKQGVGFAVKNKIAATLKGKPTPVNDQIMTMKLPF